jgi:hypothetical protein
MGSGSFDVYVGDLKSEMHNGLSHGKGSTCGNSGVYMDKNVIIGTFDKITPKKE